MKATPATLLGIIVGLTATASRANDLPLFNTEIYVSPWFGESPSKGTFSVRHESEGEPPEKGYFKKHGPGEIAEFHLFTPNGLDPKKRYPLLIVYHGGKDGASGKGMCRNFARLSTEQHPVIVLSPNMYTMDAYNELIAEGKLPIDRRRVVVYGHSSGGMGVVAGMREFVRTKGKFVPAAMLSASTTAQMGPAKYPPCPYYVIAGERETPEFVNSEILKNRRYTCRIHSLVMQQVLPETRYIEIRDSGHSGGTPAHAAIIQHAIAVSERAPVEFSATTKNVDLQVLVAAVRSGEWNAARKEIGRLDELPDLKARAEYEKLRDGEIFDSLERWFTGEVEALGGLSPKSNYVERDRAFRRFDRCSVIAEAFADTSVGDVLTKSFEKLADAKHLQAELQARTDYLAIVSLRSGESTKEKLRALLKSAPDTEYGRHRTREKLLALDAVPDNPPDGPPIVNPYFSHVKWRVWRDDDTPVDGVRSLVRDGKETKSAIVSLQPTPVADRIYPAGRLHDTEPIKWETRATPSEEFAGIWDDVYASWSKLHGYVRSTWRATDGSAVNLRPPRHDQIIHFVETRKTVELRRCGINFVHQSTTGMGHTLTNSPLAAMYERIYFSDCLVTGPAHQSFTEEWPDRTRDLYLAHSPTFFNSVGSSNSETMAITKWMIVGGYLPPASKLQLKRHGLYPSALLYIWKASLPYDVPYCHELRHRIAYRALGREDQFAGGYGHAGGERGNLSLEFHRYDEIAHMRNMIRMAQSMNVLPPEAILDNLAVEGGKQVYGLKKSALIIQEPGQEVTVKVSTAKCYDLTSRPLTVRWKLLYGNHATTCEPGDEPDSWVIRVPWDESLPEGRTAVALIANNGQHDSNPAIVTVFRKHQDLPPNGTGYGDYKYDSPHANRRPVIVDLQDRIVKPGETVRIALRGIDPEGQPVRFFKRAGEPGQLDGNLFTFQVPKEPVATSYDVTFMASDGTAGNSYAARRVQFVVVPKVHSHISARSLIGPAPLTVKVSADGSHSVDGEMKVGWEFYRPAPKHTAADWDKQPHDRETTHTFKEPGLYEIALTVKSGDETDRETVHVWVTDGVQPPVTGGNRVEGNGVRIRNGDDVASAFDHTHFGTARDDQSLSRTFELFNQGDSEMICSEKTISITGMHAEDFRVTLAPRQRIEPGGYSRFVIQFRPRATGTRTADVTVSANDTSIRFAIAGTADIAPTKSKQ